MPSVAARGAERLLIGAESGTKTNSGRNMPLPVDRIDLLPDV
jgi:hypothetical protein